MSEVKRIDSITGREYKYHEESGKFPSKETLDEVRGVWEQINNKNVMPYTETDVFVKNTEEDKKIIKKIRDKVIKEELKKPGLKAQVDAAKIEDYKDLTDDDLAEMFETELKNSEAESKNSDYYTPEISEFHVGFEYEIKYGWGKGSIEDPEIEELKTCSDSSEWQKKVFSDTDTVSPHIFVSRYWNYSGIINDKGLYSGPLVRVKYLDREDLKELGFTKFEEIGKKDRHYGKFKTYSIKFGQTKREEWKNKTYGATIYFENKVHPTFIRIDGQIAPGPVWGHSGSAMFRGYIKSKSELKRLLKQLNIE